MGAVYSNTLARIQMGRLLNAEQFKRLSEADYADALKMLAEYGYGGGVAGGDIDTVIARETNALISFIEDDCVNAFARKALLNRFYYSNAKALYKSRFADVDLGAALYNVDLDMTGIVKGDYNELDVSLTETLEYLDSLETPLHPKTIDTVLTKAMYADSLRCAKRSHSRTLNKYFVSEIDLNNILSVLRANILRLSAESVAEMLVDGGTLSQETLLSVLTIDPAHIAEPFERTPYAAMLERLAEKVAYTAEFETGADDYLYMLTESGAVSLDKFDVFLRYVLAQLTEFKMVKMILVCAKNGVKQEIAARMRCIDV
ncbi:MAG: V-type ATPase subunit [Clostridia bacterium]|nr:V-type ATPase subunit [Clostridia bacterium]